MRDPAVSGRASDLLELHVHRVLDVDELSAVHIARLDFQRNDMSSGLVQELFLGEFLFFLTPPSTPTLPKKNKKTHLDGNSN